MSSTRKVLINLIQTQLDTQPPEEAFLTDLKAVVIAENSEIRRSPYYKPSSLGCQRVMYFDRLQAKVDTQVSDYSGVRICQTGSDSHERIQYFVSKMKEYGKDCEYIDVETYVKEHNLDYIVVKGKKGFETKLFDTRYNISFLCDGIIRYKGVYYILEIKTETDSKGMNRTEAAPEHKYQSVSYSLSLGINRIMWLYEERNFCVPKTFVTKITDKDKQDLIYRFEFVDQCVRDLTPPPKCDNRKTCTYCCYKTACKEAGR